MANFSTAAANQVDQWSKKLHREYVRDNELRPYMGMTVNAPIQMIEELARMPGDDITVSLLTRLTNSGVTGDNTLQGNEEALGNYGHKITVDQIRNAVRVGRMEQKKTHIQVLENAKPILKDWAMSKLRDDVLAALGSPHIDGSTVYASASEANKDAWLAANSDRVLFGAAKSNNAADDHSAALAEIDSSNDILQPAIVSLAKRMAKTADRHIRPVRVDGQGEWFILLANSLAFRDLKNHSTMTQANREAMMRGKSNPLFTDGDLMWDGVIIREIPEISVISGVGASSIDVAPNYLLGAQAAGVAVGEKLHNITHTDDYGNLKGTGVAEIRGVDKLMYNSIQNGVLTVYTAGVADT